MKGKLVNTGDIREFDGHAQVFASSEVVSR